MKLDEFDVLKKLFNDNGFRLYIVGGTSRDLLLKVNINDFDFVTDATPNDIIIFLKDVDMTFAKYGSVHVHVNNNKIDITTMREEGEYDDSRHPSSIKFIKDIEKDSIRRDFTINAIYIDENYQFIDPQNGLKDLKEKIIRMIGNPEKRITEDPLRMLRALRFSIVYKFDIEPELKKAIEKNYNKIDLINSSKIKEEFEKLNHSI